jgi:hypothetical protein
MNIHYIIKNSLNILLTFICSSIFAQNNFDALGESSISLNHKVSKDYSTNFSLRSRYVLYNASEFQYLQQQVDILHFSTFKLNYNHKLSLGILYRNRDWFDTGSDEIRFTQQFNYTKQTLGIRYGHRVRLEQRLQSTKTIFRQRYRFGIDFPLNGEKLDIGESYIIINTEALLSISKKYLPLFDQRFTSQIGWQIDQNLKLQSGLEYRIESYNEKAKNRIFLLTSAIFKL